MKKILFAIFAVAALALTSCEGKGVNVMDIDASKLDNTTPKCWKYTIKEFKETSYIWCTERELVELFQSYNKSGYSGLTVHYKEASATDKEACESRN